METITSKQNSKILEAVKLKDKKYREKFNKVLLESPKVIEEAIKAGYVIESLFVDEKNKNNKLTKCCKNSYLISDSICKQLSFTINSQNVFAVIGLKAENKDLKGLNDNVLILDGIQNPDNLGAIIRSAVATGFTDILAINSVDKFNDKVVRASMGNVFKVNLKSITYDDIDEISKTHIITCADMDGENIFKMNDIESKIALVIGNEGNGVSDFIRQKAKKIVSLPMENNVESLNASVSASILMYEISYRIRRK